MPSGTAKHESLREHVPRDGRQNATFPQQTIPPQSMVTWNRQVYMSTTIPRYTLNLTDSARFMFQSTWWFDSSKAKTELDWNPSDILQVIHECVAEKEGENVGDELDKKKQ